VITISGRGILELLERNQSKRAITEIVEGGFFLRKKPLGCVGSGYSYSGFAMAGRSALTAL
jgi:hypothetical protein